MTFALNPDLAKELPPTVATILQEFVAALAATMTLESVILFGSAAEGRLRPTSDVNLLVIADDWTLDQLDAVRLSLRSGRFTTYTFSKPRVLFICLSSICLAAEPDVVLRTRSRDERCETVPTGDARCSSSSSSSETAALTAANVRFR